MAVGKSTLALNQIAEAQKQNKVCCYIDLEHSFDINWAQKLGVDLEKLILIEEIDNAEQVMDIIIELAKKKVVDLVIVDSIQAFSPKAEQEKKGKVKSIADDEMALLARKLGKFFRVAGTPVFKGKVSVVLIGQVRTMGLGSFFTREGLSGGRALKHWAVITLYMRRGQKADAPKGEVKVSHVDEKGKKEEDVIDGVVGFDCSIKIEKTKISGTKPELTELHLPFYFEHGFKKQVI